jgi:hypothetical protein
MAGFAASRAAADPPPAPTSPGPQAGVSAEAGIRDAGGDSQIGGDAGPAAPPNSSGTSGNGGNKSTPPPDAGTDAAAPKLASGQVEVPLKQGDLVYGPTLTLVRIRPQRSRLYLRDYSPEVELVPSEVGFQIMFRPSVAPWRIRKDNGGDFQLLSAGGTLLFGFDRDPKQGSVSLAATLGLVDDVLLLGVGFDLYRGIPLPNGETAPTGIVGWGLSRRGEVTPENVFFTFGVNLASIIRPIAKGAGQ